MALCPCGAGGHLQLVQVLIATAQKVLALSVTTRPSSITAGTLGVWPLGREPRYYCSSRFFSIRKCLISDLSALCPLIAGDQSRFAQVPNFSVVDVLTTNLNHPTLSATRSPAATHRKRFRNSRKSLFGPLLESSILALRPSSPLPTSSNHTAAVTTTTATTTSVASTDRSLELGWTGLQIAPPS